MPKKRHRLLPIDTLINKLSFSKKFTLLACLVFIAVSVALSGLYVHMHETIQHSNNELKGLTFILPVTKSIQLFQQHRGLSSAVLSGVDELSALHIAKKQISQDAFTLLASQLPAYIKQGALWHKINHTWQAIANNGMQWTQFENYNAHTKLINQLLLLESMLADDYEITTDVKLDTFYLIYSVRNNLLSTMEILGQIRAYGAAILGNKNINSAQKTDLIALITRLKASIIPLKVNMAKASHYNPTLAPVLTKISHNIETLSQTIIDAVEGDILTAHYIMSPVDYFKFTTNRINEGYTQLYETLLPTVATLIQVRMNDAKNNLYITFTIVGLLLSVIVYFMLIIYCTMLANIKTVSHTVSGFVQGNMEKRIYLNTCDELSDISKGFNSMADELVALMTAKQNALDSRIKMANSVPGGIFQFRLHADGCYQFLFASKGFHDIFGTTAEDISTDAIKILSTICPADIQNIKTSLQISAENLSLWQHEFCVQADEGALKWLLGTANPEREASGATLWHGFISDISKRKQAETAMAQSEAKFRALFDTTADAILTLDEVGFLNCNPAALKMFHLQSQQDLYNYNTAADLSPSVQACGTDSICLAKHYMDTVLQQGTVYFDWTHKRADTGEPFVTEVLLTAITLDNKKIIQMTIRDISERKKIEEKVRQLAFYDSLTHLPNRRLLSDRLTQAMTSSKRSNKYGALMFLDLDNFKPLNDTHGHALGDMLLLEAAQRLNSCVREIDTVARFGGDEFVVMLVELNKNKEKAIKHAEIIAEKIRTILSNPYSFTVRHEGQPDTTVQHHCTASIGVATFIDHKIDDNELMKQADAAMYAAKKAGRNQIKFY